MKYHILSLALAFTAMSLCASEHRFSDHKYNISFPSKIAELVFDSMSMSEDHIYEVRYAGTISSSELEIDLLPNDRTYPIYENKVLVRYTSPISNMSCDEMVSHIYYKWKATDKMTILSDWREFEDVAFCTYSLTKSPVLGNISGSCSPAFEGLLENREPRISFHCKSIHRYPMFTLIASREFADKNDFTKNHIKTIFEIRDIFSNQRVDPTVKTPVESGNVQGTAGHP